MADEAKQRISHKVETWDSEERRWTQDDQGNEQRCGDSFEEVRKKYPSMPVRLVQVAETTTEVFSPPAPWAE